MAATPQGLSRMLAALVSATTFDPIDFLGNAGLEKAQGLWVCNTDPTNIAYLAVNGAVASVGGQDCIPLLPRQWLWIVKPAYNKSANPVATNLWSLIGTTATCNIYIVADNGGWHPAFS